MGLLEVNCVIMQQRVGYHPEVSISSGEEICSQVLRYILVYCLLQIEVFRPPQARGCTEIIGHLLGYTYLR